MDEEDLEILRREIQTAINEVEPYFLKAGLANPFSGLHLKFTIQGENLVASSDSYSKLTSLSVGGPLYPATNVREKLNKALFGAIDSIVL